MSCWTRRHWQISVIFAIGLALSLCVSAFANSEGFTVWEDFKSNSKGWGQWRWDAGLPEVEISNEWSTVGDSSLKIHYTARKDDWGYQVCFCPVDANFKDWANITTVEVDLNIPHDRSMKLKLFLEDAFGTSYLVYNLAAGEEVPLGEMAYSSPGESTSIFDLRTIWIEGQWDEPLQESDVAFVMKYLKGISFRLVDRMLSEQGIDELQDYVYIDNIRIK